MTPLPLPCDSPAAVSPSPGWVRGFVTWTYASGWNLRFGREAEVDPFYTVRSLIRISANLCNQFISSGRASLLQSDWFCTCSICTLVLDFCASVDVDLVIDLGLAVGPK